MSSPKANRSFSGSDLKGWVAAVIIGGLLGIVFVLGLVMSTQTGGPRPVLVSSEDGGGNRALTQIPQGVDPPADWDCLQPVREFRTCTAPVTNEGDSELPSVEEVTEQLERQLGDQPDGTDVSQDVQVVVEGPDDSGVNWDAAGFFLTALLALGSAAVWLARKYGLTLRIWRATD